MSDGLLKHILRRNCPIRKPGAGLPHRDNVWNPVAILRLVVWINCTSPCSDHRTGGRGSFVAVGAQSNLPGKNEILDRGSVVQDLLPGRIAVPLDFAQILGPEQDSSMPVSAIPSSSPCSYVLDTRFRHLPLRNYAISPDSFDAFGVKCRLGFIWGFILEPNVTLLSQQNAWEVDLLSVGPQGKLKLASIGLTFSNFNLMGEGFMTVIVSAMSYPIRNA